MSETAVELLGREHDDLRRMFTGLTEPEADRTAIWTEIVKRIATHVAIERTFVYPLVKHRRIGRDGLAGELHHDYRQIEHLLVLTERRKINSPDMPDLIGLVLDAFDAHEQRCATVLAPDLQDKLPRGELEKLGVKMAAAESVILSHPHPYLLATGPLYRWTTRAASGWDRLRDRTVRNR